MPLPKAEIKTYFGQCKCCLNYAYLKNMWEQHWADGERVNYGKMLVDCFSISWTIKGKVEDDKICEVCISKVEDAVSFKKQVLLSQRELLLETKVNDVKTQDEVENSVQSDVDKKVYEDVEFLEEDILDDGNKQSYEQDEDKDIRNQDEVENRVPSGADKKLYEEIEFLDEDILDDGNKQSGEQYEDSKPDTKKRKWPRALPRNKRHKTYRQYTEEQLKNALEAVKSKELTVQQAVETYNIPRKTISLKIKNADVKKEPAAANETLSRKKVTEFIKTIQAILTHTNATPFRSKANRYFCIFCPVDSANIEDPKDLRAHTHSTHTDKVKQIEFVLRPYYYNEMLRLDVEDLTCNCNTKATWQEMLDHLETEHDVTLKEPSKRIIPYTLTPNDMACALCDYTSAFTNMDAHMNSHYNNYICGHCGDSFITASRLNSHVKIHQIGIYPCNICDKMFSREMYRKKHIAMIHERKLAYKCFHCDERFLTGKLRHSHMESEHKDKLEIKSRTCKACNKTFSWGMAYSKHLRRYCHAANTCDECGKSFENQRLLDEHKLRHAGVKKYECDVCKKPYFSRTAVTMHKKYKHSGMRERSKRNVVIIKGSTSELGSYLSMFTDEASKIENIG